VNPFFSEAYFKIEFSLLPGSDSWNEKIHHIPTVTFRERVHTLLAIEYIPQKHELLVLDDGVDLFIYDLRGSWRKPVIIKQMKIDVKDEVLTAKLASPTKLLLLTHGIKFILFDFEQEMIESVFGSQDSVNVQTQSFSLSTQFNKVIYNDPWGNYHVRDLIHHYDTKIQGESFYVAGSSSFGDFHASLESDGGPRHYEAFTISLRLLDLTSNHSSVVAIKHDKSILRQSYEIKYISQMLLIRSANELWFVHLGKGPVIRTLKIIKLNDNQKSSSYPMDLLLSRSWRRVFCKIAPGESLLKWMKLQTLTNRKISFKIHETLKILV
jgi:hypothetical protein